MPDKSKILSKPEIGLETLKGGERALIYVVIERNHSRRMGIYLLLEIVIEGLSCLTSSSYYLPSLALRVIISLTSEFLLLTEIYTHSPIAIKNLIP